MYNNLYHRLDSKFKLLSAIEQKLVAFYSVFCTDSESNFRFSLTHLFFLDICIFRFIQFLKFLYNYKQIYWIKQYKFGFLVLYYNNWLSLLYKNAVFEMNTHVTMKYYSKLVYFSCFSNNVFDIQIFLPHESANKFLNNFFFVDLKSVICSLQSILIFDDEVQTHKKHFISNLCQYYTKVEIQFILKLGVTKENELRFEISIKI